MINEALKFYPFDNPKVELLRHNENMTYKITDGGKPYVLRIHKPSDGFELDLLRLGKDKVALILDEMELLKHLAEQGNMHVQKVKLNSGGEMVSLVGDENPVTVLEWIEGETLEDMGITAEFSYKLGVMIGELHNALENKTLKNRYRYDESLLSVMIDEVPKAREKGHFNNHHAKILTEILSYIRDYLSAASNRFMIIHTDLGKSNLIYSGDTIIPIDFSLSGHCIPEMDLASAFAHFGDKTLRQQILSGYRSISKIGIESTGIEICYCLQILLFITIQHNKYASESWFQSKLNDWCEQYFSPLIAGNKILDYGF